MCGLMDIIKTYNIDTAATDMYLHIKENMTSDEIQDWLKMLVRVCISHMDSCKDDPEKIDQIDESFLMYENALLYLIGQAEVNGLNKEGLH